MHVALWLLGVLLIVVGLVGSVLPALPGIPFIFGGILLVAWADDFRRISVWTLGVLAVMMVIGIVVDFVAASITARRAGASRLGVVGALVGTIAGVFSGLWGLLFMPLLGAMAGEFISHQEAIRAGKIGLASWIGMLIGIAFKLAIAFAMIGVFLAALLF